MEARRDTQRARAVSTIESRRAAGDAARERIIARNASREEANTSEWRKALREGR